MSKKETKFRVLLKQTGNGQYYCACLQNNHIIDYKDTRILNGILKYCTFLCSPVNIEECKKWLMGFWVVYYQSEDSFDRTKIVNSRNPFNQDILLTRKYPRKKEILIDPGKLSDEGFESSLLLEAGDDEYESYKAPNYYEKGVGDFMQPIIHIANIEQFKNELDKNGTLWTRSYQITDNSIWNYLIPISPYAKIDDFLWQFEEKFRNIVDNYSKGLYFLAVAYEFADLNARLAKEAFLSSAGKLYPEQDGDHASAVAPFIFHSEKDVENNLIEKEFLHLRNTTEQILTNKWRILLVDDKAESEMSYVCNNIKNIIKNPANTNLLSTSNDDKQQQNAKDQFDTHRFVKEKGPKVWNCKLTIIKDLIEEQFGCEIVGFQSATTNDKEIVTSENLKREDVKILIEYAENIKDAKDALKQKKYDIILLDYLLRPKKKGEPNDYGYMLLEDIVRTVNLKEQFSDIKTRVLEEEPIEKIWFDINNNRRYEEFRECLQNQISQRYDQKDMNKVLLLVNSIIKKDEVKKGTSGRFFFIFISAYSTAVYERLLAEGLNRSEKYWNIAVGACPTNTPKLFLYNLIKLMEKRLDDSGVLKLSGNNIYTIVNKIYGTNCEESDKPVRYRANKYYQDVLDMHYYYRKMLSDVHFPADGDVFNSEGSVLITNFLKKNVNLGGFLEHLTQLVHLTAFGTVRQWPEMWEEYIYFKAQFNIVQFVKEAKNGERKFKDLCVAIEDHILKLKSDVK